jgi:hypothetical protein
MSEIDITIYVNNKWHAQRRWSAVPRVGDEIVVADGDRNIIVDIKRVLWGYSEEDFLGYQSCTVALYCRTV